MYGIVSATEPSGDNLDPDTADLQVRVCGSRPSCRSVGAERLTSTAVLIAGSQSSNDSRREPGRRIFLLENQVPVNCIARIW